MAYVVAAGDTLFSIATKFNTTAAEIAKLNGLADPNTLALGQKLKIPVVTASSGADAGQHRQLRGAGGRYPAPRSARRFGTTVAELQRINGIANADVLSIGQKLIVPSGGTGQTPAAGGQGKAVCRAEGGQPRTDR